MRAELVGALARAAGLGGMVGGQMLDLAAEGRFAGGGPQQLGEQEVRTLQAMKTGALLRFACEAGGILGSATPPQRAALERYGSAVGQAFQIADDLLDLEGDPALVGKSTGKDAQAGKATIVGILGAGGREGAARRAGRGGRHRRWRRSGRRPLSSTRGRGSSPIGKRKVTGNRG